MKEHTFRLVRNEDLLEEINYYVQKHHIEAGVIACGVGCLLKTRIRQADGVTVYEDTNNYEIVSLHGTVGMTGSHIHISLSDNELKTIGGHLMNGCLVNTTAEIIIFELSSVAFRRKYDELTGYKELVIEEK